MTLQSAQQRCVWKQKTYRPTTKLNFILSLRIRGSDDRDVHARKCTAKRCSCLLSSPIHTTEALISKSCLVPY